VGLSEQEIASLELDEWTSGPAPTTEDAYPRLVCAEPELINSPGMPRPKFVQAVARLANVLDRPLRFKNEVLKLASSYALLHPFPIVGHQDETGDTLSRWEEIVKFTRFTLELSRALQDARQEGETNPLVDDLVENAYLWCPAAVQQYVTPPDLRSDKTSLFARLVLQSKFPSGIKLSLDEVTERIHRFFWEEFRRNAKIEIGSAQFLITGGGRVWLDYELAMLFGRATELRVCANERCRAPFFPARRNQRVCDPSSSRCRQAALRQRMGR